MALTFYTGDNLETMRGYRDDTIDLIYLDPPYYSQRDFGEFTDVWNTRTEYLQFLRTRLVECKRLLKPNGSLYLQCDNIMLGYLQYLADDILGVANYRNTISWIRHTGKNSITRNFSRDTDYILFYAMNNYTFNTQTVELTDERIKNAYRHTDKRGRYAHGDIGGHAGGRTGLFYTFQGYKPPKHGWKITKNHMQALYEAGLLYFPANKSHAIKKKIYLSENAGKIVGNIWTDIPSRANKRIRYPTEKPLALLERIIKASSNEGDTVMDPFMGSGTSAVVCKQLGRDFIGIDINANAIELARQRTGMILC